MSPLLAATLEAALLDVRASALREESDPLRLDIPPDQVEGADLDQRAAAALGSLYLLSELEQVQIVASAELLVEERWSLGLRDPATVEALEAFARSAEHWTPQEQRTALYARLFGAPAPPGEEPAAGGLPGRTVVPVPTAPDNAVFEELLAGFCTAVLDAATVRRGRPRTSLRLAGDRLRANLAPRQFGNTLVIAPALVDQLRAALDLLADPQIAALLQTQGLWGVVRALNPGTSADIGRRVDRGRSGRVLVAACGRPVVAAPVDEALTLAADTWLVATGFDTAPARGA